MDESRGLVAKDDQSIEESRGVAEGVKYWGKSWGVLLGVEADDEDAEAAAACQDGAIEWRCYLLGE